MIKIFDFLYFGLYSMFALIKRVGEEDESLASSFYSILLCTNTFLFLFVVKWFFGNNFFFQPLNRFLSTLFMVVVYLVWYFTCRHYFLKKENFRRILAQYQKNFEVNKWIGSLIGIVYTIITFLSFIILAMCLSK